MLSVPAPPCDVPKSLNSSTSNVSRSGHKNSARSAEVTQERDHCTDTPQVTSSSVSPCPPSEDTATGKVPHVVRLHVSAPPLSPRRNRKSPLDRAHVSGVCAAPVPELSPLPSVSTKAVPSSPQLPHVRNPDQVSAQATTCDGNSGMKTAQDRTQPSRDAPVASLLELTSPQETMQWQAVTQEASPLCKFSSAHFEGGVAAAHGNASSSTSHSADTECTSSMPSLPLRPVDRPIATDSVQSTLGQSISVVGGFGGAFGSEALPTQSHSTTPPQCRSISARASPCEMPSSALRKISDTPQMMLSPLAGGRSVSDSVPKSSSEVLASPYTEVNTRVPSAPLNSTGELSRSANSATEAAEMAEVRLCEEEVPGSKTCARVGPSLRHEHIFQAGAASEWTHTLAISEPNVPTGMLHSMSGFGDGDSSFMYKDSKNTRSWPAAPGDVASDWNAMSQASYLLHEQPHPSYYATPGHPPQNGVTASCGWVPPADEGVRDASGGASSIFRSVDASMMPGSTVALDPTTELPHGTDPPVMDQGCAFPVADDEQLAAATSSPSGHAANLQAQPTPGSAAVPVYGELPDSPDSAILDRSSGPSTDHSAMYSSDSETLVLHGASAAPASNDHRSRPPTLTTLHRRSGATAVAAMPPGCPDVSSRPLGLSPVLEGSTPPASTPSTLGTPDAVGDGAQFQEERLVMFDASEGLEGVAPRSRGVPARNDATKDLPVPGSGPEQSEERARLASPEVTERMSSQQSSTGRSRLGAAPQVVARQGPEWDGTRGSSEARGSACRRVNGTNVDALRDCVATGASPVCPTSWTFCARHLCWQSCCACLATPTWLGAGRCELHARHWGAFCTICGFCSFHLS
jgi:hypothetical protein